MGKLSTKRIKEAGDGLGQRCRGRIGTEDHRRLRSETAPAGWAALRNDPAAPPRRRGRLAPRIREERCPRPRSVSSVPRLPLHQRRDRRSVRVAPGSRLRHSTTRPHKGPPFLKPRPAAPRAYVTHAQTSLPGQWALTWCGGGATGAEFLGISAA